MRIISTLPTVIDFMRCIIRPSTGVDLPLLQAKIICENDVFKWNIIEDLSFIGKGGTIHVPISRSPFIYFSTEIDENAKVYIFKDAKEFSDFMLHHFTTIENIVNYLEKMHNNNEDVVDYLDNFHTKIKLVCTTEFVKMNEIENDAAQNTNNTDIDSDVE